MRYFPPESFVTQIALNCPQSLYTYMLLWNAKDSQGFVHVKKDEIILEYMVPKGSFQKHLIGLAREGLINIVRDKQKNYTLELVLWD